jgi:hypothetical protein
VSTGRRSARKGATAADAAPAATGAPGRITARDLDPAAAGVPVCRIQRSGSNPRIVLTTQGLLAAGALFQVIPVFGAPSPTPEEQWQMTVGSAGVDAHDMATSAKNLEGDGINFQVNLCALSNQFTSGSVAVTVEQDGQDRPIVPPMSFTLPSVAPCQSAASKITPTNCVGGFAFVLE